MRKICSNRGGELFYEPRSVTIYLTRQLGGENLAEICREYGLKTHSWANSAVGKVKVLMKKEKRLKNVMMS